MKLLEGIEQIRVGLDYHLSRHNVLTANLAHVDTPGYKPLDLVRDGHFSSALDRALVVTDPRHIGGGNEASATTESFRVREDPSSIAGADGNAVSVDREAVKIATNHVRYETLATLASSELAGLSWAAKDGVGG